MKRALVLALLTLGCLACSEPTEPFLTLTYELESLESDYFELGDTVMVASCEGEASAAIQSAVLRLRDGNTGELTINAWEGSGGCHDAPTDFKRTISGIWHVTPGRFEFSIDNEVLFSSSTGGAMALLEVTNLYWSFEDPELLGPEGVWSLFQGSHWVRTSPIYE